MRSKAKAGQKISQLEAGLAELYKDKIDSVVVSGISDQVQSERKIDYFEDSCVRKGPTVVRRDV